MKASIVKTVCVLEIQEEIIDGVRVGSYTCSGIPSDRKFEGDNTTLNLVYNMGDSICIIAENKRTNDKLIIKRKKSEDNTISIRLELDLDLNNIKIPSRTVNEEFGNIKLPRTTTVEIDENNKIIAIYFDKSKLTPFALYSVAIKHELSKFGLQYDTPQ